jgi:hypothetical protein
MVMLAILKVSHWTWQPKNQLISIKIKELSADPDKFMLK